MRFVATDYRSIGRPSVTALVLFGWLSLGLGAASANEPPAEPASRSDQIRSANDYLVTGDVPKAREVFDRLLASAKDDADRRQAYYWLAAACLHEEDYRGASSQIKRRVGIAEAAADAAGLFEDYVLMGDIMLAIDRPDLALAQYRQSIQSIDRSGLPAASKSDAHRQHLYNRARGFVAQGDLDQARVALDELRQRVDSATETDAVHLVHEIDALIAIHEGRHTAAIDQLARADHQDPRVLLLLARTYRFVGNDEQAKLFARQAAEFDGLDLNYGYVRAPALELLAEIEAR